MAVMSYRVPLPAGGRSKQLDLVSPNATSVHRAIRRGGLGAYETSTAAAFLAVCEWKDPGFVLYDVGANMGLYSAMAASMFSPRAVHAFEPTPETADVFGRIVRRNRLETVQVHRVAAADTAGFAELYLSPVSDSSNSLVHGFRETDRSMVVETVRLDDVVERTGDRMDIVKIDVETFERSVLDGARTAIERDRPVVIIEVLRRKGRDHGVEISEFFAGLGYSCFELSGEPDWQPRDRLVGSGTTDRDWLLLPDGLPDELPAAWQRWRDRLGACTADRNPRVPVMTSVRAARQRGGWREVLATANRYRRSRRRTD